MGIGGRGRGGPTSRAEYVNLDDLENPKKKTLSTRETLGLLKSYFWPEGFFHKFLAILSLLLLVCSKFLNIIGPLFVGKVSKTLLEGKLDVWSIVFYCAASAGATILKEMQNFVYLYVQQTAYIEVAAKTFGHIHNLSLNWHLTKKTGTAMRSMDRGIESANSVVKYLFMYLVPTIIEAIAVCVIFVLHFKSYALGGIAFSGIFLYSIVTYKITRWRKRIRTKMNKQDNDAHDKAIDSLVNFATVKYFTNEDFELSRYRSSMEKYQSANVDTQGSLNILNSLQSVIFSCSIGGCLVVAGQAIVSGTMSVGDFVTVIVYMNQLFAPLGFLGTIFNIVVQAFVDMENLSELLAENPDVSDVQDAPTLILKNQKGPVVEFKDVYFNYPEQPVTNGIQGISFKIESGTTTAIVGHTGAGKSTISKLLFRFYDVNNGSILIDGQKVNQVTQTSLRKLIGIVPQDTVLFNDTMMYNIRYGKITSSDEDVVEASKAAQINDFVNSLENGYFTSVGERGLKLSGGEKQRVAIARTLLKNPPLLILDEATSSLDSTTETQIQAELDEVCVGRTTIVIAHRLSTIINADQIIVLGKGKIIERGRHSELLKLGGAYSELWFKQVHGGEDETEAVGSK